MRPAGQGQRADAGSIRVLFSRFQKSSGSCTYLDPLQGESKWFLVSFSCLCEVCFELIDAFVSAEKVNSLLFSDERQ